jgi:hypothetical protein
MTCSLTKTYVLQWRVGGAGPSTCGFRHMAQPAASGHHRRQGSSGLCTQHELASTCGPAVVLNSVFIGRQAMVHIPAYRCCSLTAAWCSR